VSYEGRKKSLYKFFFFRSKHPATFAELQLKEKGTTSAAVEEAVPPHLVERTKKLGIKS
jgi:hypothetical protein